jgi:hypothetical protein
MKSSSTQFSNVNSLSQICCTTAIFCSEFSTNLITAANALSLCGRGTYHAENTGLILLRGADHIENTSAILLRGACVGKCLPSRCLVMLWTNLLQYVHFHIAIAKKYDLNDKRIRNFLNTKQKTTWYFSQIWKLLNTSLRLVHLSNDNLYLLSCRRNFKCQAISYQHGLTVLHPYI